jgi:hypothetical protein
MESEDLLGPGCSFIWENPWTQCFLLHGTFSTVRFAERGKREPAKRHLAEEAFWPIFGDMYGSIWGYKDGLVLLNSTEMWNAWSYGLVPLLFGDNLLAAGKILPIERTINDEISIQGYEETRLLFPRKSAR